MDRLESADDQNVAYLIVNWRGEEVYRETLTRAITIGRQMGVDVWVNDPALSRNHCRIEPDGSNGWRIVDLKSRNGVYINHQQVEVQVLQEGDRVRVGDAELIFKVGAIKAKRPQSPEEAMFHTHMQPMEKLVDPLAHTTRAAKTTRVTSRPITPNQVNLTATPDAPLVRPFGLAFTRGPAKPILTDEPTKDQSTINVSAVPSGSGGWLSGLLRSLRSRWSNKRNVA